MKPHIASEVNLLSSYFPWGVKWCEVYIWTAGVDEIDLATNVWLHSSVGRASHRYRGGHGFESRWSPDFFQASSFQLLKLIIYCDDHSSLSSTPAVQIWIISYTLHIIEKLCFGNGLIWTVGLTIELKLWFEISPSWCGRTGLSVTVPTDIEY